MKFFDHTQPLALPKGSVRALLVLLFGIAIVFPIFKFAAYHEDIPQTVKEIMLVLVGGLQAIVNKYFEIREKEKEREAERVTEHADKVAAEDVAHS
jgi:hypothetical protein